MSSSATLSADDTPNGRLPPFEVAKAYAFDVVLTQMEKHMGKSACVFLGQEKGDFIAKHLALKGGGHPSRQCVFQNLQKRRQMGVVPRQGFR